MVDEYASAVELKPLARPPVPPRMSSKYMGDVEVESPLQALEIAHDFFMTWWQHSNVRLAVYKRDEKHLDPKRWIDQFRSIIAFIEHGAEDEVVQTDQLCDRLTEVHSALLGFRKNNVPGDPYLFRGLNILDAAIKMLHSIDQGVEMERSRGL